MQTFELNGKTYQVESMDNITTVAVVLKKNGETDKRFKPTKFNTDSIAHLLGGAESEQLIIKFDETATPTATDGNNKYVQILQNGLTVGMSDRAKLEFLVKLQSIIEEDNLYPRIKTMSRENCSVHYYGFDSVRLDEYHIMVTVHKALGSITKVNVTIDKGAPYRWDLDSVLMGAVDKAIESEAENTAELLADADKNVTHEVVTSRPYFKQALEDAIYYSDSGELPEYAWLESTDEYCVYIGNTVLVDGLGEIEAEILTDILHGHLYDNITLWENDNVITGYVENNLFYSHIEEKAVALYGDLEHDELVKAANASYSIALRTEGIRNKDVQTIIKYHSLEKHLDLLLEYDENVTAADIEKIYWYGEAKADALFRAENGEDLESEWLESRYCYGVCTGDHIIMDGLGKRESELLHGLLTDYLYDNLFIEVSDNAIDYYLHNNLAIERVYNKAVAVYDITEKHALVSAVKIAFKTSLKLLGAPDPHDGNYYMFHSLEKHLDGLLEKNATEQSEVFSISKFKGEHVVVCQTPVRLGDDENEPYYMALALKDGECYAARWELQAQISENTAPCDWENISHMHKL